MSTAVSLENIRAAREIVYRALSPTALGQYPLLDRELGARCFLKHENHLPTGAFKIRGGLNFMHHFAKDRTHHGVITATRGNHGQSIAMAAARYEIPSTIVVPFGNNPEKNEAMIAYGARLIEYGRDFDEAREEVERLSAAENLRYVHSANEPTLLNGVGTYALEILEEAKRLGVRIDAVFVPIGMGSGLCGVITAFRTLSPETKIYGVQAEGAPSYFLSWRAGHPVPTAEAHTFADGIATRSPSAFALEIILKGPSGHGVDEVVLVSESEITHAIRLLWKTTHNLVEGAGAAPTAAAVKMSDELRGKNVVHILSGGNLDTASISKIFA